MTFPRRRMRLFCCVLSALLVIVALVAVQGVRTPTTARAATNQFRGVNWANPDDNFVTGNLVPVGLSTADSYATTYAKATAILKGFQNLGANTVRLPFNAATTSGSWWGSYTAAWDAASALGMKVVVAPWLQNGTVSDTTSFYQMWDTVVNKYGGNSNIYFDIMNEPWAYTPTNLINFEVAWLARYPNVPRGRVIVPGSWEGNLCAEGADSRLNGTLLSVHLYSAFGTSFPTEADWVTDLENALCGYSSRAVLTEFGAPMNTGANYDGPRDGTNDVSYMYAMTDTVRNLGMGSILWVGVKQATQTQGPGPCENASCAITSLNGSGTNLSLSIINQSGLDRLQYGWGVTGGPPPTPTPTPISGSTSYEAESSANTLGGRAVVVACTVCSGGSKVGNTGKGGTLQFNNVKVSSSGTHTLTLYYIDGDAGRTAQMSINGATATTVTFHGTNNGNWNTLQSMTVSVQLNSGNNTILFSNAAASGPDFDRIVVS